MTRDALGRLRVGMAGPAPLRWLFAGDSVTQGASHTGGARDYVQLVEERLRWEMGRRRDHVIRTGVSGWTVQDLASDLDWSVLQYRPHVVSLMFGLNDAARDEPGPAAFAATYRVVVDHLLAAGVVVLVHTPNPVPLTETPERVANLPHHVEEVRRLARERDVVLIDHDAAWASAAGTGTAELWMSQGCHPNAAGHRLLARTTLERLGLWDGSRQTGRLFVPGVEAFEARARPDL